MNEDSILMGYFDKKNRKELKNSKFNEIGFFSKIPALIVRDNFKLIKTGIKVVEGR
jgi:hypothetical protein